MRQKLIVLLKLAYLAILLYSGKVCASFTHQAELALLQQRIIKPLAEICGGQYNNQISALRNGLKERLKLAGDRRQGVDLKTLEPSKQEVEFIAQQMCKSGRISVQEVSNLHSQYTLENFEAQQESEYSGSIEEELSVTENEENADLQAKDISRSTLVSKDAALAFCFGMLSGSILLHYFILVKGNTPDRVAASKVRRPEL